MTPRARKLALAGTAIAVTALVSFGPAAGANEATHGGLTGPDGNVATEGSVARADGNVATEGSLAAGDSNEATHGSLAGGDGSSQHEEGLGPSENFPVSG